MRVPIILFLLLFMGSTSSAQEWITDILRGRGVLGPYTLRWAKMVERTESVFVDGRWLLRNTDYTIDGPSGRIVFKQPVRTDQEIRVNYQIIRNVSQANTQPDVPLQIGLARLGGAELGVTGRVASADTEKNSILGLYGNWKAANTHTEALYLTRYPNHQTAEMMKLTGGWSSGGINTSLLYSRAEKEFGDTREYGVIRGQEVLQADIGWNPNAQWSTRFGWQQASVLETPDHLRQRWNAALGYQGTGWSAQMERAMIAETGKAFQQTDRTALQANLTSNVQIKLNHSETQTENAATSQQTQISLNADNARGGINVSHQVQETGNQENTRTQIGLKARVDRVSGQVGLEQQTTNETVSRAASMQVAGNLDPRLQVGGEYRVREDAGQMRGVEMRLQPLQNLFLSMRHRQYEGLNDYWLQSRQFEWQFLALPNLSLSGNFTEHPEDNQGRIQAAQKHAHQLSWLVSGWNLQMGYAEAQSLTEPANERTYRLGLQRKLDPATLFRVSYQQTDIYRDAFLREATLKLGLTRRLGWLDLSLEAGATLPRSEYHSWSNQKPVYTGSAKLGVKF
jgi:hypothetical protein